ncbi:hypothetical protein SVIOM342S_05539 [Streptomyces violaceorubidus]
MAAAPAWRVRIRLGRVAADDELGHIALSPHGPGWGFCAAADADAGHHGGAVA